MVKSYKPVVKKFLGMEVRTVEVNGVEYIILKDMFNALGRVRENGDWYDAKTKMIRFLSKIGKLEDSETLGVLVKQGKIKTTQQVECLKLETVPIVLTQFEPTARTSEEMQNAWVEFMKFVDALLVQAEAHKFIMLDIEYQKETMARLTKLIPEKDANAYKTVNSHVALLLGLMIDGKEIPIIVTTVTL